jgi:hypothetical protein
MFKYIWKFEIPVHNFVLDQGLKSMEDLYKIFDCLFFWDVFLFLEVDTQVSFIAILKNQVNVINSLFDINQANDVVVSARLKYLNFIVEQLSEFA